MLQFGETISAADLKRTQARERALVDAFRNAGVMPLAGKSVLEVGCGGGRFLLQLIRLGFDPARLTGIDTNVHAIAAAKHLLPQAVRLTVGDARVLDPADPFDLVFRETRDETLAPRLLELTRSGGAVVHTDPKLTWIAKP